MDRSLINVCKGGEECFEVDRRSGLIRTTGRPLTPSKEYHLRVQSVDGQGRKGPPATVSILAGYRPPQFTNSTYSLNVPENTPVGQPWVPQSHLYIIGTFDKDVVYSYITTMKFIVLNQDFMKRSFELIRVRKNIYIYINTSQLYFQLYVAFFESCRLFFCLFTGPLLFRKQMF